MLHYFLDLRALFLAARRLLRPGGGRLVVRDFHPASTKLLRFSGASASSSAAGTAAGGRGTGGGRGRWKVDGSYFDAGLAPSAVAYAKHAAAAMDDGSGSDSSGGSGGSDSGGGGAGAGATAEPPGVLLRRWTVGEVVTAAAEAGLGIVKLEEEPGARLADAGVPKLFTLVCERR